jgi:hypothetical protein
MTLTFDTVSSHNSRTKRPFLMVHISFNGTQCLQFSISDVFPAVRYRVGMVKKIPGDMEVIFCTFHGLGPLACPNENQLVKLWILLRLLQGKIGLSQGLYIQRTTQHQKRGHMSMPRVIQTHDPIVRAIQYQLEVILHDKIQTLKTL